ncbi:putative metalloprotease CJM1_0395 family protein [Cellvibrio sp. OA-2007]|uniref:putative metalloprotease CJM1_0395 family protein n=1 Tax=Cellvibrio sp. OA-2007 TaxID=529823 RepID=UPI000781797B|nr:putative metalloprotease CJM1_0395 family protein [Cellvibrio sp. OA-2007]
MINNIPSSFANTVAPFAPMGRAPVGQETTDLKSSSFRPAEQSAESGRGQNRRFPDERPNDDVERDRVERGAQGRESVAQGGDQAAQGATANRRADQERQQAEREQIQTLAARDREVRAHEQAHAAVAGQYGSSPTYSFVRGPDGVSYAVGGEVKIDTSPIPGDPEATLRKAQQLRRAANAPADPSSQDGSVAAQAAQMEQQARAELREQQAIEAQERRDGVDSAQQDQATGADEPADVRQDSAESEKQRLADEEARLQADQERFEAEQRLLDQRQARAEFFNEGTKRNIDLNRRLIEIGVFNSGAEIGSFLNKTV